MKRFIIYALIGVTFGVFDNFWSRIFAYMSRNDLVETILVFAVWLVPTIPVVYFELKVSASKYKAAWANALVWSFAIISYYFYEFIHQIFVGGNETLAYLYISNHNTDDYWIDLWDRMHNYVFTSISDWLLFSIITGFICGLIIAGIIIYFRKKSVAGKESFSQKNYPEEKQQFQSLDV